MIGVTDKQDNEKSEVDPTECIHSFKTILSSPLLFFKLDFEPRVKSKSNLF